MPNDYKISTQAILSNLRSNKDGTIRLTFDLNEDMESYKKFMEQINKFGKLEFSPE
ncbi:MAG: hypothetical protein KKF27_21510 [Gammaproteobacteria bacterium]|nr:hypothetical protein [Gammaproteobacteria bacterium]